MNGRVLLLRLLRSIIARIKDIVKHPNFTELFYIRLNYKDIVMFNFV
jgi:hypothetical protein